MKLYKKALLIMGVGLSLSSCLDLDPQDQLADGNLWSTPSDFEYFANTFYGWTRDFKDVVSDGPHSDWRSDLMTSKSVNVYSHGNNAIPTSDDNYTKAYDHIRRTNILLEKAQGYGGSGSIAHYVAEAKFFRAYSYFDLLQLYGDAIITTSPLDIDSPEMNAKRNDRSEVTDLIVRDLQEAAADLPETPDEEGRLTCWAAYAFLSRVALYEGTWQKFRNNEERAHELLDIAAKAAREVIDGGKYELFKPASLGTEAYRYLFILEDVQCNPAGLTKSANKEYILSRRHDEALYPIGTNVTKGCLANTMYINRKFVNMYLTQNGLPIEKDTGNDGFQGYDDMDSEFENRDNRMANCLLKPGQQYWNNTSQNCRWGGSGKPMTCEPAGSGYMNQKWATERLVNDEYEGYDYPVIRYAEVLLNYAEAANELYGPDVVPTGQQMSARQALQMVRDRASTSLPQVTASSTDEFREVLKHERQVELAFEDHRYWDLLRWKDAEDVLNRPVQGVRISKVNGVYSYTVVDVAERKFNEANYRLPFLRSEIENSKGTLVQNPGY